mgnify:CR=1 FL=1
MDKIGLRQVLPDVFADNPPVGSEIWRRDVTFDKGRVYLVEAASGSGKSSFCGYLYGYRRDYSGTILFDDRDIRELSVGEWSGLRCRSLAMMFQGLRLFPELSAVDNVRLKNNLTGRRSEAEIACREAGNFGVETLLRAAAARGFHSDALSAGGFHVAGRADEPPRRAECCGHGRNSSGRGADERHGGHRHLGRQAFRDRVR